MRCRPCASRMTRAPPSSRPRKVPAMRSRPVSTVRLSPTGAGVPEPGRAHVRQIPRRSPRRRASAAWPRPGQPSIASGATVTPCAARCVAARPSPVGCDARLMPMPITTTTSAPPPPRSGSPAVCPHTWPRRSRRRWATSAAGRRSGAAGRRRDGLHHRHAGQQGELVARPPAGRRAAAAGWRRGCRARTPTARPERPRPCVWRRAMIHRGPASPAAARLNASVLVEPASSRMTLRKDGG